MSIEDVTKLNVDVHSPSKIGSGFSLHEIGITSRDFAALAFMFSREPISPENNLVAIIEKTLPTQTEVEARR